MSDVAAVHSLAPAAGKGWERSLEATSKTRYTPLRKPISVSLKISGCSMLTM